MNSIDIERCKRIVQYLWDPEPKNDEGPDIPIWCLGRKYVQPAVLERKLSQFLNKQNKNYITDTHCSLGPSTPLSANEGNPVEQSTTSHDRTDNGWPEAFLTDLESKIWMTYRSNFAPIPRPDEHDRNPSMTLGVRLRNQLMDSQGFTSDTGWGCMIRSGQSLLANCLLILTMGRDWRRGQNRKEELQLLSLFIDLPEAPFSIHQFVKHGAESCSKYPGEWFGPSATAKCIQILSSQCEQPKLRVYVTNDTSDVYQDKFMSIACDDSGRMNPTLILLGIRLGIDHITPVYWDGLRAVLQYPQSVGIAGGRPSASHYFVGVQGPYFFYLDPHHTRPALPYGHACRIYTDEELDTYHTRRLRRIHIKDMDPSMLIGFLIRDENDWVDWKDRVKSLQGKNVVNVVSGEIEPNHGHGREEALDEVEALDDTDGLE